jgi:hypothetical protein
MKAQLLFWKKKKRRRIHHIAFDVTDIYSMELTCRKEEGFQFCSTKGADNKCEFLHQNLVGVLIELYGK